MDEKDGMNAHLKMKILTKPLAAAALTNGNANANAICNADCQKADTTQ